MSFNMTETVAVTGGNGRIGTDLLEYLGDAGYTTVNLSRGKQNEDYADEYLTTDLLDAGEVYGSLARTDADAIVHLGMIPNPDRTPGFRTFESNALSSYHVLEAADEFGIDTVVLASSLSAMGGAFEPEPITVEFLPVDESRPLTPSTPYGLGKQTLEIVADGFARRSTDRPRTITSVRFPWVVDDGRAQEAFVEPDRSLAAMRDTANFRTERNSLFSYLHVSDAVALVEAAIEAEFDGHERVWASAPDTNVETPTSDLIADVYPDATIRDDFAESTHAALVDGSKAGRLLDWEPTWSWREFR